MYIKLFNSHNTGKLDRKSARIRYDTIDLCKYWTYTQKLADNQFSLPHQSKTKKETKLRKVDEHKKSYKKDVLAQGNRAMPQLLFLV